MISLVVPTYKELANIPLLVDRAGAALAKCNEEYELIIVDDNSPDGTADEVRRLAAENRPWLRLLVRERERDLSTAVIAGWRIARGDILGCMDADLQHPPEVLPSLIAALRNNNADIVVGSRHVPGGGVSDWSLLRRFVSWTATLMAAAILPGTLGKVTDPMSGLFLVRAQVIVRAALNPIGYKILLEVLARGNYSRVAEVPYVFEERTKGGSKMTSKTVYQYLAHLVRISIESGEAGRMMKYSLVGLTGALINIILALYLFLPRFGWPLPVAALAGAGFAMMSNFLGNELYTFRETHLAQPGGANVFARFLKFCAFSLTGLAINIGTIALLYYGFHAPLGWTLFSGVALGAIWNFLMNSNLTWEAWWNRRLLSETALPPVPIGEVGDMVYVPCNLCQSSDYRILYAGKPTPISQVTAQAFRCTSLQHGDFTNIVQCSECGLLYENPREPENLIERRYEQVEDPVYEREIAGRVRTYERMMPTLEKYCDKPGSVLDIGCYLGDFLDVARKHNWETIGVEPSAWAAERTSEQGHRVINAPLHCTNIPANSFDLVTLWDVIEHLYDPLGQLREIRRLLRPGGIFALTTMDAGSFFAKITGRHWPWYMRMNLYYFTRGTLTRMLDLAGFEVVHVETHQRIVSLRYLLEKVATLAGIAAPLFRLAALPFGRIYVTVDFGDNMTVISRARG